MRRVAGVAAAFIQQRDWRTPSWKAACRSNSLRHPNSTAPMCEGHDKCVGLSNAGIAALW